jgi:predicted RNA binding protein YcfA (HicA-like mRNA interferase family)
VTRLHKRIEKLRSSPNNATYQELTSVLLSLGFVQRSGKGSHALFKHPQIDTLMLTIPNNMKSYVVKQVLKCIDENQEIWEDEFENN